MTQITFVDCLSGKPVKTVEVELTSDLVKTDATSTQKSSDDKEVREDSMTDYSAFSIEFDRDGTWDIWHGDHKIASKVEPKKVSEIIHKEIAVPPGEKDQWFQVWHRRPLRTKHAHE